MPRILIVLPTCVAIVAIATAATAQTTTPTQATAPTKPTTTTQSTAPTSSSTQGAFDKLFLGNQKIAQSLCDAQPRGCPSTPSSTQQKTLSRDQIAAMKQHRSWGEIFKDMQKNGQVPADVENLGQLVSGKYHPQSGTSGGTAITSASGRSQVVGNSGKPDAGRSGKGRFDDDASASAQGSSWR